MEVIRTYKKGQEISYTLPEANEKYTVQMADNVKAVSFSGSSSNNISQQIVEVKNFGEKIQTLDDYCFYNCKNIDGNVYLSPTIKNVNKRCFSGCSSVKLISYMAYETNGAGGAPQLVKIGEYAFADCQNVNSITLPESIDDISKLDDNAFAGSNLTSVTFLGIESKKLITE